MIPLETATNLTLPRDRIHMSPFQRNRRLEDTPSGVTCSCPPALGAGFCPLEAQYYRCSINQPVDYSGVICPKSIFVDMFNVLKSMSGRTKAGLK